MPRTSCRNTGYQNELEDVLRVLTGTWTISYDPAPVQDVCPPAHRRKVFLLSEIVGEGKMRNATVLERGEKSNPMDLFYIAHGGTRTPGTYPSARRSTHHQKLADGPRSFCQLNYMSLLSVDRTFRMWVRACHTLAKKFELDRRKWIMYMLL